MDIVTGAYGFTGKYIARRLISLGRRVKTLTNHPGRVNHFGDQIEVAPLAFDEPKKLVESIRGGTTLYNTYWVRFPHGQVTFQRAVQNTKTLIGAAREAGIRRIIHLSVTNASENSGLPYFRWKGVVEREIAESQLSVAIIRPTVVFGLEDILINNIAWLLRRFPVFAVPGSGDYRVQPVSVEDVAEIAISAPESDRHTILDAVGPEIFRFDELVKLIADKIGSKARIICVGAETALFLSRVIGWTVQDVLLTREEVQGLMSNLLISDHPPAGRIRLSEWLAENAEAVGKIYASELRRHYR